MSDPSPAEKSIFAFLYEMVLKPMENKFAEFSHFSPVIFTLGSLFLSLVTLNYPIFLFSLASGEALLAQNVLKGVSDYLVTADSMQHSRKESVESDMKCKSKYQGSEATKFKYLLDNGFTQSFPNSALYFLSFASAYCLQAMSLFTEECYERGGSYSTRPYIAYISTSLCMILFCMYNLIYSCDTPLGVLFSVLAGLFMGFILCYQNLLLFGKAGVDMLFIPPLVSRSGMDYICVSTN